MALEQVSRPQLCDVEVDPETGVTKVVRYLTAQDAGRAISPDYVEGQMQGGVVQGIGWALNEEYIHDTEGVMENPSFLTTEYQLLQICQ